MVRTCRTIRWPLTLGVILGLGLTGLFPQAIVGAHQGVRDAPQEQPTECCCGTKDGRCCGMGCCGARQSPSKERSPCPVERENRDGGSTPFTIAAAKASVECGNGGCGSLIGCPSSDTDRSIADASLQARHVRIDV